MRLFLKTLFITLSVGIGLCWSNAIAAENQPSYMAQSGNFQAILMPIDVKDVAEFDKPEHDGPRLKFKTRAVHGDQIALKIVFMGMELTNDMQGHVTYDLIVTTPNGSTYEGSDIKNVQALEGKVLKPQNVFNSPATLVLKFEPKDQLGTYNVTTTVRDNIGKREVLLKHAIELVDAQQS